MFLLDEVLDIDILGTSTIKQAVDFVIEAEAESFRDVSRNNDNLMILIGLMILSVMEYVVRREMKKYNKIILGPGKIKMSKPSLRAIMGIFEYVPIQIIKVNKNCIRKLQNH